MIAGCQQPAGPLASARAFGYLGPTELASGHGVNGCRYRTMTENGCRHGADDKKCHAAPQTVVRHVRPSCRRWVHGRQSRMRRTTARCGDLAASPGWSPWVLCWPDRGSGRSRPTAAKQVVKPQLSYTCAFPPVGTRVRVQCCRHLPEQRVPSASPSSRPHTITMTIPHAAIADRSSCRRNSHRTSISLPLIAQSGGFNRSDVAGLKTSHDPPYRNSGPRGPPPHGRLLR